MPLSRIILGWPVTIRSMHEGFLWGSKFVGSVITWDKPRLVKSSSIITPSGVVSPLGHQNCEYALKSPAKKVAKGFSALMFKYRFSKFDKRAWNSGEVWPHAGLRYRTVKNIFFRPNFNSTTIDSLKDKSFRIITGREFLSKR